MTRDVEQLEKLLAKGPEDWSVRITLIEERIRRDDSDGAKQLVRDSPDSSPLPYDLKYRLHQLMTRGKDVLAPLPLPEKKAEPQQPQPQPVPAQKQEERPEIIPVPAAKEEADSSPESDTETESAPVRHKDPSVDLEEVAPVKDAIIKRKRAEVEGLMRQEPKPEIELTKNTDGAKKWDNYRGNLLLTDSDLPAPAKPRRRRGFSGDKLSALTLAVFVHVIVLVSLTLVTIVKVQQRPPQLIVSVDHEKEVELQTTKLNKTKVKKLSAAAARPVNVISSTGVSLAKVPEMEVAPLMNDVSLVAGVAPTGLGMSFTGDTNTRSDVSFFGISGGGDRVVFVIDATKNMLIDEKGGMFAYDKVKNEIGAMLQELRTGTYFNILVYDGKEMVAFREKPVSGLPSNRRKAFEWLDPLNRTYEDLGIGEAYSQDRIELTDTEVRPIQSVDNAYYTKCIQKAMEWQASAIFCISNGYGNIGQSPTPEMIKEFKGEPYTPGTPGTIDPGAAKAWNEARQKTRDWLNKENEARREKGLPPKVVVNFNQLVRQVTGATPPRRTGGTPGSGGMPGLPNHTGEDIELHVKNLVKKYYDDKDLEKPSVHMVLFLGEKEQIGQHEDHFKDLTRKNRGKLKVLRGLAELKDVTGG